MFIAGAAPTVRNLSVRVLGQTIASNRNWTEPVLPASRLSVIGFRTRYSLGDTLELSCATDYSRPRPALAWFINNQLVSSRLVGQRDFCPPSRD